MIVEEFANKLLELYYTYEDYCFLKNQKMCINIDKDSITYSLLYNNECVDEFIVRFIGDGKDKYIHDYLTLFLTAKIFGCVEMHFRNDEIYNDKHRSYLKYTIDDEEIIICQTNFLNFVKEYSYELRNILKFTYDDVKEMKIDNIDKVLNRRIDISKTIIKELKYKKEHKL